MYVYIIIGNVHTLADVPFLDFGKQWQLDLVFGCFPHGDFLTHQDKTTPRMVELA